MCLLSNVACFHPRARVGILHLAPLPPPVAHVVWFNDIWYNPFFREATRSLLNFFQRSTAEWQCATRATKHGFLGRCTVTQLYQIAMWSVCRFKPRAQSRRLCSYMWNGTNVVIQCNVCLKKARCECRHCEFGHWSHSVSKLIWHNCPNTLAFVYDWMILYSSSLNRR